MGSQDDRVLDLIGQVYDAALDERLWRSLAPRIATTFQSTSTALHVRNTQNGRVDIVSVTDNLTPEAMDAYADHYWQHDLWVKRAIELGTLGTSAIMASEDMIADRVFEESEYYQDWCRKLEVYYVVGSVFPLGGDEVAALGVHRQKLGGAYGKNDKCLVSKFLPHLTRAMQLRQRLLHQEFQRGAALDALERTGAATVVADRSGRVLYANGGAERLLREADAICVVSRRLATTRRSATERLTALIRSVTDTAAGTGASPGGSLSIPRADRLPLTILVAPFRPAKDGFGAAEPAAILFIRDPSGPTAVAATLQQTFGLTPTEAAVAGLLADGKSIEDVAVAQGVSLHTARTHLKSIFLKTDTNRQAQLIALLLRSVAMLGTK